VHELKLRVYEIINRERVKKDFDFCDQIRRSARSAPRNIAEGFGRYLPGEFAKYLRVANGELKETTDALRDGFDCGYLSEVELTTLQRLAYRASKATTNLIAYLRRSNPPNEHRR